MGLEKAKSLLEVKDGASFLDLIARQVGGAGVAVCCCWSPLPLSFYLSCARA